MTGTRAWRVLLCAAAVVLCVPTPASAQPAGDVTWSVVPAGTGGPDGRRVVDVALAAGERVTEHVAVTNHSDRPVTFAVDANDGYLTAKGLFDMRAADVTPTDGGSWIEVADEVSVDGGATAVVPLVITAPPHATPGDHPAGVTASLATLSGQVRVQNRVGVRLNIRVTGDLRAALALGDVRATYRGSWNPFAPGAVEVRYDVTNEGNVRASADVDITTSTAFGEGTWTDGSAARAREVLPGGTREFDAHLPDRWPLGRITTRVVVSPATEDGATAPPVTITVTTWALPIPQASTAALVVLLVLVTRALRRRRRRRLADLIARAKAEGRAEAAQVR